MTAVIEVEHLTKRYRGTTAVDDVNFTIESNTICGLLGRNGAGKSTLMNLLTGQEFATSGSARVLGANPLENPAVLEQLCFVKESQRYPDDLTAGQLLRTARHFYPRWDADYVDELVEEFRLPLNRAVKKLSRGQRSSVGVIIGLAARAPITIFDEPYLGLDAVARQAFYDRLLADYAENPRTILLSTHLIDEVADLLEHAIVIDGGRILMNDAVDALRTAAATFTGPAEVVEPLIAGRAVVHSQSLGSTLAVTLADVTDDDRAAARVAGLSVDPVSLQQLIIHRSRSGAPIEEVSR